MTSTTTSPHSLSDAVAELVAARFGALADPTRIRLLDRMRAGEASVLELTESVGGTQQNVSKHLGVLLRAGVVARRKDGNFALYCVADEAVFSLCEVVCGSLERQAAALHEIVATRA